MIYTSEGSAWPNIVSEAISRARNHISVDHAKVLWECLLHSLDALTSSGKLSVFHALLRYLLLIEVDSSFSERVSHVLPIITATVFFKRGMLLLGTILLYIFIA